MKDSQTCGIIPPKDSDTPHSYGYGWKEDRVTIDREEYDQLVADSCLLTWLQGILNLDLEKLAETAKRIEV
jgi:hypothetical protein